MGELTMVTFCQFLANITLNRCHLVENSNTCRCAGDIIRPISPKVAPGSAPDIMSSEVFLIFFVLAIWLSAIGFCLNQYKSLRRLETQVHYCVNRKDPLNIGDIKIVAREQDSIIYKKKRYSTLLDTHVNTEELKNINYVQQYLPKNPSATIPSTLSNSAINQVDLPDNTPVSIVVGFNSTNTTPSSNRQETTDYQASIAHLKSSIGSNKLIENIQNMHRTVVSARFPTGLAIPHISSPSSLRSSWNDSNLYDANGFTKHLCVPSHSLRSNRLSEGNISLPVPRISQHYGENSNEKLLDPRLIPAAVRRSLLALHRESQENINLLKKKDKTRSENDVNGSFTAWKIKMKSKLKRTHHQHHQTRSYSNTFLISTVRRNSNDGDQSKLEQIFIQNELQNSTQPYACSATPIIPSTRRSLAHYQKCSTQSTSESETMPGELPTTTSICCISADEGESILTVIENN
ncbi:unnamed protein product [Rotaria socialis]|uniref:Uncharacterized protein n=1 Tax=Rotaria socialis TaxID=392032 RepID=A0A817MBR8_9BILA|nr:unnamed protein product [Rotaria socialis]